MKAKKLIYLSLVTILVFGFSVSFALAAEFRTATKGGNSTVSQDETVKNLYTVGNVVSIDGVVEKDLYALGNVVTINSDVETNLCVAGSTVIIKGNVGGSVHAGGSSVVIEGEITDDLMVFGGNIVVTKSASVGGDLIAVGGNIDIQGPITGKLTVTGGQLTINSKIEGETDINVGELRLGKEADIAQDLTYQAPKEAEINEEATILGVIDFTKKAAKKVKTKTLGTILGLLTLGFLLKILIAIVSGLVLVYLFGNITKPVIRESLKNFWPSLGIGFAALILTPIAAVILAVTILGLWLAGLVGAVYVLMLILATPLASIAFGSWLIKLFGKKDKYSVNWQTVVLGVIVLNIIILIPLAGWLVGFIFVLISLGALYRLTYKAVILSK